MFSLEQDLEGLTRRGVHVRILPLRHAGQWNGPEVSLYGPRETGLIVWLLTCGVGRAAVSIRMGEFRLTDAGVDGCNL